MNPGQCCIAKWPIEKVSCWIYSEFWLESHCFFLCVHMMFAQLSTTISSLRACIYICLPVWSRNIFAFCIFDLCSILLLMLCFVNVLSMQEFMTHFGCMRVMLIKWIRYWDNNLWSFTACLFLKMYATGTSSYIFLKLSPSFYNFTAIIAYV
jgi:hypothetical protein